MENFTQRLLKNSINKVIVSSGCILLFVNQAQGHTLVQHSKANFTIETNRVWINASDSNGAFSQTLIGYRTGATDGVDHGLDGAYMNNGAIAITSLIGSERYAIQFKGLPFSAADVVPLSFSASYDGTFTFAIDHMDGFFMNSTFAIYIHDTVNNTYNNLKTGSYSFTVDAGMYNNRFELIYDTTLGTNQNIFTADNLNVSQSNSTIVINSGNTLLKEIILYSINGKLLYQNRDINSSQTVITSVTAGQQPIIIKATTQEGITFAKKCFLL